MDCLSTLLATTDTIWTRLAVCAVSTALGTLLIVTGRRNIRTQVADESGSRRVVNRALGRNNQYEGGSATGIGWARVVMGICFIIFGIVFVFVGPFLADK